MGTSPKFLGSKLRRVTTCNFIMLALLATGVRDAWSQSSTVISSPRQNALLSNAQPVISGTTVPGYNVALYYCLNGNCNPASWYGYNDYVEASSTGKFSFSTTRSLSDSGWDYLRYQKIPHTFKVTACRRRDSCLPDATVSFYTDTYTKTPKWYYPTDKSCLNGSRLFFNIDAESDSSVYLSINGQPEQFVPYTVYFSSYLPLSTDGVYSLVLTTQDKAGNKSAPADPITITVDSVSPAPPVVLAPTNNEVGADSYTSFAGKSEANARVTIKVDYSIVLSTRADSSGDWAVRVPSSLSDGVHTVSVVASDCAGNQSGETTLSYRVGPLPPSPIPTAPITIPTPSLPAPSPITLPVAFLARKDGVMCGFVNDRWEPGTMYTGSNLFLSFSSEIHHMTLRANAAAGNEKQQLLQRASALQATLAEQLPVCGQLPKPYPTPTPTPTVTQTPIFTPTRPSTNMPSLPGSGAKLPKDLQGLIPRYSDFIGHIPIAELRQAAALFGLPLDQVLDSLRQSENYLAQILGELLKGNLGNLQWIQAAGRYSGSFNTNPDGLLVLKGAFDKQKINSQLSQILARLGGGVAFNSASSDGVREVKGLKNASGGKAPPIYVTVIDGEGIVISSSREDLVTAVTGGFTGALPNNFAATVAAGSKVDAAWSAGSLPAPDRQNLARWIGSAEQGIKAQSANGKSPNLAKLGNIAKDLQNWGVVVDVQNSQSLNLSSKMSFTQPKSAQLTKSFAREIFRYYTAPKGVSAQSARLSSQAAALKETKFKLTVKGGSVVIQTQVPKKTATKWNPPK